MSCIKGHSTVSMIPVENSVLPFPDLYSNDLRKHMLSHPVPPQKDPLVIAQQLLNRNTCNFNYLKICY